MKRMVQDITKFIFMQDEPQKADVIFIVGGTYAEPAELAAQLYHNGLSSWIMPSGKYSAKLSKFPGCQTNGTKYTGFYESEWEFMRDVLQKNGVKESAILREDQSQYTYQNAAFARKTVEDMGLCVRTAILCCQAFHARRAFMYYQLAFPETHFFVQPADTQGITKNNWMMQEFSRKVVFGELMRCGEQFCDVNFSEL